MARARRDSRDAQIATGLNRNAKNTTFLSYNTPAKAAMGRLAAATRGHQASACKIQARSSSRSTPLVLALWPIIVGMGFPVRPGAQDFARSGKFLPDLSRSRAWSIFRYAKIPDSFATAWGD